MKKITTLFVLFALVFGVAIMAAPTFALDGDLAENIRANTEDIGETVYGESANEGDLLTARIAEIIKVVLGFLGVVVVIIVIYAGFLWMTAGGTSEKVEKAKSWMINAVIGLAIILSAYAITDFVIERLLEAAG
ncbi:hypothetical protein HN958_03720 [Candidatus Falkowbacteria bacterium]|jgi:hypothetical protein|nr:hypothetical protein [Candidatus Falkowbacteria bacterium]MBT7007586.1 hypothetical protein [Candidatus Falkowbacteria bacterium]